MEPVTHLLTGLIVARAGANRLAPTASTAVVVGALLPDVDSVYTYGGIATFLQFHLGWTHSLAGLLALGAVIAFALGKLASHRREEPRQAGLWVKLALAAWLGLASHLLLDWVTASGARWLWPLAATEHGLDWFAPVDPGVLAALLLGLAVPALFRLIAEEIGERAGPEGARHGARAALVLFLLLCALRGSLHRQAVAVLDAQTYRGRTPVRVGALPASVNPFRWFGVVETDSTYELVEVTLAGPSRGTSGEFTQYKPAPSPALEAAARSRVGRVFLASARFPLARIESLPDGQRVVLRDLRFTRMPIRRRTQAVWVELDRNLEVTDAGFGFRDEN